MIRTGAVLVLAVVGLGASAGTAPLRTPEVRQGSDGFTLAEAETEAMWSVIRAQRQAFIEPSMWWDEDSLKLEEKVKELLEKSSSSISGARLAEKQQKARLWTKAAWAVAHADALCYRLKTAAGRDDAPSNAKDHLPQIEHICALAGWTHYVANVATLLAGGVPATMLVEEAWIEGGDPAANETRVAVSVSQSASATAIAR